MTALNLAHIARRFPLVDRPRPAYPPIEERINEITRLAADADRSDEPLPVVAQALNKAALIASDCGLPDLARELCWRQVGPYRSAERLTIQQARHMLEPVVNLARLRIRADDAAAAWSLLNTLHHALKANTDPVIEGIPLPTSDLTGSTEEYRELRRWMWGVYLSEGTRALVQLGRWQEALTHADQNKGIGRHLLDGRQVKIVSGCLAGDAGVALAVLEQSTLSEPWEAQVAACLWVMCRLAAGDSAKREVIRMIEQYLAGTRAPGQAVFRARLGLTVVDLTARADPTKLGPAYACLISEALASADGYVAREVLSHEGCKAMLIGTEEQALATAMQSSGLGLRTIPAHLMPDFFAAVMLCETVLERSLPLPPRPPHLRDDDSSAPDAPHFSVVNGYAQQ
ncbi:hypothetical protein [Nonomuraea sp. JJY05]|uniref:hypothetical protein n=1 Tax=Nonomuraea sp. JJY05 TaxID=3350255 RepID=UPI00373E6D8F